MNHHQRYIMVRELLYEHAVKKEEYKHFTESAHIAPLDIPTEPQVAGPLTPLPRFDSFRFPTRIAEPYTVKGAIDGVPFKMCFK